MRVDRGQCRSLCALRGLLVLDCPVDHGLRIISGHAEGKLPKSESQLELLADVLPRWTPIPLADLGSIRTATRAVFDKYFG